MIDLLVDLFPPIYPFLQNTAIFGHRVVELNIRVLFPFPLSKHGRRFQLVGIEIQAETKLARDDFVQRENDELDIVAVLLVPKLATVVLVSRPTQFSPVIEVKELDSICFWVDEEVPRAYIAVNNAQAEVEVIDSLL